MKKKVSIVTSGHPFLDERIFYKFARSLNKNGYEVSIICSTVDDSLDIIKDDIQIIGFNGSNLKKSEKVSKFEGYLKCTMPDLIICCEPLPILAANRIRKQNKKVKIVYDVTEWYPENVAFKFSGIKKINTYLRLFIFNVYAANLSDVIIIGEKGKKKRYDLIAPCKAKKIISYYPVLEFFDFSPPIFNDDELILCYAGLLKLDRGIKQLLETARGMAKLNKELRIKVKLVGKFESQIEERRIKELIQKADQIEVEICGWFEYSQISNQLSNAHLCFDLRERNFIYNNSLPIKIFEYMACGKPFIYSDIKPIKRGIEFEECGFLVDPNDLAEIIKTVEKYYKNKGLLTLHSNNARTLIEERYNWEKESGKLISLINSLHNSEKL